MPTTTENPDVKAHKAQLRRVARRIDQRNTALTVDYATRNALFKVLYAEGVSMSELAKVAGVSKMAVSLACKET